MGFDTFPDSNIPEVHVILLESAKNNISLLMNHHCALCNNYGHYSHRFLHLEYFCDTLQVLRELETTRSDSTFTLPTYSHPTPLPEHEISQPPS